MKLRYVGPFDAIEIPDLGIPEVKRNGTFEVPADAAALLLEQVGNYAKVSSSAAAADPTKVKE